MFFEKLHESYWGRKATTSRWSILKLSIKLFQITLKQKILTANETIFESTLYCTEDNFSSTIHYFNPE